MKRAILLGILLFFNLCYGHGFGESTIVHCADQSTKKRTIKNLCQQWLDESQWVISVDLTRNDYSSKRVRAAVTSEVPWYCTFRFNDEPWDDINCSPDQEFLLYTHQWIPAHRIKVGDLLLSNHGKVQRVSQVTHVKQSCIVYVLEVKGTHTFFVGRNALLTHNILLPIFCVGVSASCGSGAVTGGGIGAFFGPVTLVGGVVIGGFVGLLTKAIMDERARLQRFEMMATTPFSQTHWSVKDDKGAHQLSDNDNEQSTVEFLTGGGGAPDPHDPNDDKRKNQKPDKEPGDDFDDEKFKKALHYATTANSLNHFFDKPKHGFDQLLDKMGGIKNIEAQKKLVEAVLTELRKSNRLPMEGKFLPIPVNVAENVIHVKGCIHEGIIRIGTMFIPEK